MRFAPARLAAILAGAAILVVSCSEPLTAPRELTSGRATLDVAGPQVVISQLYGAGGNSGAPLRNDYVELFNRGTTAVPIGGWSVQYASATGSSWNPAVIPSGATIQPGRYFLVQLASQNITVGTPLANPDAAPTSVPNMSATTGKVVLSNGSAPLSGTCPSGSAVVAQLAYGTATCAGWTTAPAPSTANAIFRGEGGCTHSGDNAADFSAAPAAPRNSASPGRSCEPPVFTSIGFAATSISVHGSLTLVATALDQSGFALSEQPAFTWSSDNTDVLTVDATTGLAHGVALGTANVTVTAGAFSTTAVVTVANIPSIMITELNGNPVGDDNLGEWMEIYNAGSVSVNLAGFALKSNGGSPEDHVFGPLEIGAGACVVIGKNADLATNGGVPVAYAYGSSINLNNSQTDWFTLKTPDGALVDSVAYAIRPNGVTPTSFAPFGNGEGFSFELSFLALDNTTVEGGNWSQSSNVFSANVRGTPGTCPPAEQVLTSIFLTPTSVNMGGTKQLTAVARDQNGNPMFTQPAFTWSSVDPSVLVVDPVTGVATGVALGSTTVSAAAGTLVDSKTINVVDPNAVGSLSISAGALFTFPAGYVSPNFATARRADNTVITPSPALTWQTSDASIATVDELGYLTALRPGSVNVTALAANGIASNTLHYTIVENTAPHTAVYRNHVDFGMPSAGGGLDDLILNKPQFTISYNASRGGPNWVSWQMNPTHFGSTPRCDCFSPDLALPSGVYRAVDLDYRNSGFTRGHMVMSEERTATLQENAVSFLMTNILPQAAANNSGPWLALETHLNDLTRSTGKEIYVIAGGVYAANAPTLKNEGRIAIPHSVWKVALILNSGTGLADVDDFSDVQAIAVIMPNVAADGVSPIAARSGANPGGIGPTWQEYETTIDAVEAATGYDVLKLLADEIEIPLEAKDRPPVASLATPAVASEGSAISFDASGSGDPDAGDVLTYAWNFGDGSATTVAGVQPAHTYAQDGTYTVTVTVFDQHGAFSKASRTVTVANVAPVVAPFIGATILPGETYNAAGSFADPGSDAWTASVTYGDATGPQMLALSGKAFVVSHVYATPGIFMVTVSVSDDDATDTRSVGVTVLTPVQALHNVEQMISEELGANANTRSFQAKLDAATASLIRGNSTAAANQLNALLNELNAMVSSGRMTSAQAAPIRRLVERVLASITR